MTVRGFFDDDGRPRLDCAVAVPATRASASVPFLIDTGADRSVLMPFEASLLGLPHAADIPHILGFGFGGVALGSREWLSIAVDEPGVGQYRFLVEVDVPIQPSSLPSVLGRDILDRCRLTYDPTNDLLDLEVWRSDDFVPA